MKLTIVGCAPAYTRQPGRTSSCYLVEYRATGIALDFGQGSFSELSAYRSPETLDAIFISHLHADHSVDLIPLRHFIKYDLVRGPFPALYGPADLRPRFRDFQPGAVFDDFGGAPLEPGTVRIGDLNIEMGRVTHIPDSFAFRVSAADADGPGLIYTGDCGVADDLLPLIRPGDTLLSEAGFGVERPVPEVHMTAQEVGNVARRSGAARVVLTHVLDRDQTAETLDVARAAFGHEVQMAEPGMQLDIG